MTSEETLDLEFAKYVLKKLRSIYSSYDNDHLYIQSVRPVENSNTLEGWWEVWVDHPISDKSGYWHLSYEEVEECKVEYLINNFIDETN